MNTPTPTPRTDAATYPADCLGKTLVTNRDCARALERELAALTGAYTCTHHNDQQRASCLVCLVIALTAERDQLNEMFHQIRLKLTEAGGDPYKLHDEALDGIISERDQLRADCENETKWAAHYLSESIAVKGECDQLRAKAQRFQRLQRFIDTAAADMKAGLITFGGIAELRAERDELRAANIAFRAEQKACEACDEPTAFEVRQLRAEVERTDAIYQRACEVEHELRAELAAEREKAERYRLVTLRQDSELATERARLDWVFRNCKVTADDFTTGNRDVYAIHDREVLGAAMKEGAK